MAKSKVKARVKKAKVKKAVKRPKAKKVRRVKTAGKKKMAVKLSPELSMEKLGEVTHYFPHVKAAAVMVMKNSIKVGDEIYIKGHTTDFKEKINSMQVDHVPVQEGTKGQEIGLLVKSRVRIGDSIYKV